MGIDYYSYFMEILNYIKDSSHWPLIATLLTILSIILKIPQRLFQRLFQMILNIYIENKANKLSERFLYWIVQKSKKTVNAEISVYFSDLENIYPKKRFFCLGTDIKIRKKVFEVLIDAGRLDKKNEGQYIFSKLRHSDISWFMEKNNNVTT